MEDQGETSERDEPGVLPHLTAAFPDIPIQCFALMRTVSQGEIVSILDPVTYRAGHLHRDP